MGLFLGLCGGLVLSVILTFRGARAIDAAPGTPPYSDPRFAPQHNDAVAGYIGQDLFVVGGSAALALLAFAVLAWLGHGMLMMLRHRPIAGSGKASTLRAIALVFCVLCMIKGASLTRDMNAAWPGLYDVQASDTQLQARRDAFEQMHQLSERIVGAAWLGGLCALVVTPWCRRYADPPLQSGDGKKASNKKAVGEAQEGRAEAQ